MKKYSSYKVMKVLNPIIPTTSKYPQSPTHSVSYRKLASFDSTNQKPAQKFEIYPLSSKNSNITTTNATRKKMFSSKNQEIAVRPLTITKQNTEESSISLGYCHIRNKIIDLQSRLHQIKRNYDKSVQNKKNNQKQTTKLNKQIQKSTFKVVNTIKNKQNQFNKQKKTQSKLLLQRYQTNKKAKNADSKSTINLDSYQNYTQKQNIVKSPLALKDMNSGITSRKTEILTLNNGKIGQTNTALNTRLQILTNEKQSEKNKSFVLLNSPKAASADLKDFVTTFPCENKVPICHSSSETNLYKPHNKLLTNNKSIQKNLYYISAVINAFESKSVTSFENLCRNHLTTSLDILLYVKNANKKPPLNYLCKPLPPLKDNKHTIIFDLDQTLIHCNQNLTIEHDIALPIKFPNGTVLKAGINVRPYARQCLRQLSKYFELIVFTASHECYGNVIVDYLDPNKEFISYRYFRDSCFKTEEGFYVKDLRVIDRNLQKVLLIDNAAYSYCFQLSNGVPIIPFYDNKADYELKNLISYLKGFLNSVDVRMKNESQMRLNEYFRFKDTRTLVEKLYGSSQ